MSAPNRSQVKTNKVNINGLINYFYETINVHKNDFKSSSIALLFYFFSKNNANYWQAEFEFKKGDAIMAMGVNSRTTFLDSLSFLSNQVGIINILYTPNNQHEVYIARFSDFIKHNFFKFKPETQCEIDPNLMIGYETKTDVAVPLSGVPDSGTPESGTPDNGTAKNLVYHFLDVGVPKSGTADEITPILDNKQKLSLNKRKNKKKNSNFDNKKNTKSSIKNKIENSENLSLINEDEDSVFYKWLFSDIELYKKNKKDFYNHDERIFNDTMRLFKLSKSEVEKFADDFWLKIKITGDWKKPASEIVRYFVNWTKLEIEKYEKAKRYDANSNSEEARNYRIQKTNNKIDEFFKNR